MSISTASSSTLNTARLRNFTRRLP